MLINASLYVLAALVVTAGAAILVRGLFADRSNGRPRCPGCWHDMTGSRGFICPECGRDARRQANLYRTRRHAPKALLGSLVLTTGGSLAVLPVVQEQGLTALVPTTALMIVMPWTESPWVLDEVDARVNASHPQWFDRRGAATNVSAYGRFFAHRCAAVVEAEGPSERRLHAVQLLSDMHMRDDAAERALLAGAADDNPTIRIESINALIRVASRNNIVDQPRCVARMAECLADSRALVRSRAARFFEYLPPHRDALPALIAALGDERNEVKTTVCNVLARFGRLAGPAAPALAKLIDDPSPAVASGALVALGSLGLDAGPYLGRLIAASQVTDRRGDAAVYALGLLAPYAPVAVNELSDMLSGNEYSAQRRSLAMTALTRMAPADPVVLDAIQAAAASDIENLRVRVASELGRFHGDDRRQVALLLQLLADDSARVRQEAALSLGRISPLKSDQLEQLAILAGDAQFIGREEAQSALGRALEEVPPQRAASIKAEAGAAESEARR